ncbi:hypothetical protein [Chryseobacterium sp. Leaf201]|uniref:hypothetical protein n=1 Tax=Chryseobacterium sp. Leaf201 TaxID=1735672 RepID=UPI0006FE60A0|nr:hypothetical protein [Chryseobacterium sp. Leaf201]KQM50972.1 hypothetical protein ASE55_19760 [Chryseobacterium sp. Leaf201]
MIIQEKTIEKIRDLVNEETEYRSGPKLVAFFNDLGFNDEYGQGFPSRWLYTQNNLTKINGTPELDRCIKKVLSPLNFIGRIAELDKHISNLNDYLSFDNWLVLREGKNILFKKTTDDYFTNVANQSNDEECKEEQFLDKEFSDVNLDKIGLEYQITEILKLRIIEIENCIKSASPLSVIFLCGSTLEGLLLGIATKYPKEFNTASSTPRNEEGKAKQFQEWNLSGFINVAFENGIIKEDVKKFSHSLRDFRNYIHPYQQLYSGFNPDIHTAKISLQVLKAAINQIINYNK